MLSVVRKKKKINENDSKIVEIKKEAKIDVHNAKRFVTSLKTKECQLKGENSEIFTSEHLFVCTDKQTTYSTKPENLKNKRRLRRYV